MTIFYALGDDFFALGDDFYALGDDFLIISLGDDFFYSLGDDFDDVGDDFYQGWESNWIFAGYLQIIGLDMDLDRDIEKTGYLWISSQLSSLIQKHFLSKLAEITHKK